ncbi:aminotransferase class V-fold PLP-dependent enzyme [Martelella sp. HB161492]|uniref:aminotransferase class V-fold PLP-dependent enzyme n=1 Tax=Martelella sp. HB161492 TaxID=2720726 RepID=UPI00158FB848|nr:aminotransferase class V-fold PLP-dependent enzyme [Martelella sp. HB161492]
MSENLARQFLLDETVVFLNHGSYGACPRPVFEAWQSWQRLLESQPVAFLDPKRGYVERMRNSREALAGELGTSADNVVGVVNATAGLNIVAQSLKLAPGDEILTTDHEYAALEKTWAYVCRRTGAVVKSVTVPLPLTREVDFTAAVLDGMSERTRVLFLSHITSPTALVFPIESIIAEAKRRGIWTVIDGAHTPGHIPLDLEALDVDFYAGNCHKWMMAPKGSAFLYVRPDLQTMIDPLVISHGWTADNKKPGAVGPFGNTPFIDSLEMQGTRDPSAWMTVVEAIRFRHANDWNEVARRCRDLAQATAAEMAAVTGLRPLSAPQFCAPQMVAMPIPPCDPEWVHDTLISDYNIEIPVFRWKDHHIARLSVQGYNNQKQTEALVHALKVLLKL